MNKSGLCIELRELGYDCVLESFPAAVLVVIYQGGMKHILCTDEAEALARQPEHPIPLIDCLVYCEGVQWYEFEPPLYLTPMSAYNLRTSEAHA